MRRPTVLQVVVAARSNAGETPRGLRNPDGAGERAIHFMEDIKTIPIVRLEENKITVEMSFLEPLATQPAYQFEFLNLIKLLL